MDKLGALEHEGMMQCGLCRVCSVPHIKAPAGSSQTRQRIDCAFSHL